jgi:hypothetical protein
MLFRLLLSLMLKNRMGKDGAQLTLLKGNFCQLTKIFAPLYYLTPN